MHHPKVTISILYPKTSLQVLPKVLPNQLQVVPKLLKQVLDGVQVLVFGGHDWCVDTALCVITPELMNGRMDSRIFPPTLIFFLFMQVIKVLVGGRILGLRVFDIDRLECQLSVVYLLPIVRVE